MYRAVHACRASMRVTIPSRPRPPRPPHSHHATRLCQLNKNTYGFVLCPLSFAAKLLIVVFKFGFGTDFFILRAVPYTGAVR